MSVYDEYAIANVALNNDWRIYPNDDNISQLKQLFSTENLYFHFN